MDVVAQYLSVTEDLIIEIQDRSKHWATNLTRMGVLNKGCASVGRSKMGGKQKVCHNVRQFIKAVEIIQRDDREKLSLTK